MATVADTENGLSSAAVAVLAPPVRLMSAAVWKVLRQRDVEHYGVAVEFVSSVCDTVPGLLTLGHQVKLTLGLRAKLILNMASKEADVKLIKEHLERVCFPAEYAAEELDLRKSVEDFLDLINSLIIDQKARDKFFQELSVEDYGLVNDQELETLMWKFLTQLDQLLPVPSLLQTVEWLSGTPFVKKACVLAASQPQLLNILLQHQVSLGHLDHTAHPSSNSEDSMLTSLSLPPSGKAPVDWAAGQTQTSVEERQHSEEEAETPFITSAIGTISNADVTISLRTQRQRSRKKARSKPTPDESTDRLTVVLQKSRGDRAGLITKGEKRVGKRKLDQSRDEGDCESENNLSSAETSLYVPEDPVLRPIFLSCLDKKAKVVIHRVSPASLLSPKSPRKKICIWSGGSESSISASTCKPIRMTQRTPDFLLSSSKNKENLPVIKEGSSSQLQNESESSPSTDDADDYVADSEDEALRNFKGRLFTKRYYKTRHGTYVPTLREFWRPRMTQPDTLLKCKHRR